MEISGQDKYGNKEWRWIMVNKLKRTNLEISLVNLAKRERKEWEPFYYKLDQDESEVGARERREIGEWQGAASVMLDWGAETRFQALSLFDDVMRRVRVSRRLRSAVAASTLTIAAKLNEEEESLATSSMFIENLHLNLSPQDLCRMEILLLQKLEWDLRPCLALPMLQILMSLVVLNGVAYRRSKDIGTEYLNLFLKILMKFLFMLMVRSESAHFRPSTLALCLVSYHLDWEDNEPQKTHLLRWFQRLLNVNDEQLQECMKFAYPLVGFHFYAKNSPDQNHETKDKKNNFNSTSYYHLQIESIKSSSIYRHLKKNYESSHRVTFVEPRPRGPKRKRERKRKNKKANVYTQTQAHQNIYVIDSHSGYTNSSDSRMVSINKSDEGVTESNREDETKGEMRISGKALNPEGADDFTQEIESLIKKL